MKLSVKLNFVLKTTVNKISKNFKCKIAFIYKVHHIKPVCLMDFMNSLFLCLVITISFIKAILIMSPTSDLFIYLNSKNVNPSEIIFLSKYNLKLLNNEDY